MTVYENIQSLPGWVVNIGTQNQIGNSNPKTWSITQTATMNLSLAGNAGPGQYPAIECGKSFVIPAGCTRLCSSWIESFNAESVSALQASERDNKITTPKGNILHGDWQIDYSKGGMIDVADCTGKWVPTGNLIGIPAPSMKHYAVVYYVFDMIKEVISNLGTSYDGVWYPTPLALQNVTAQKSDWNNYSQNMRQYQLDLNPKALSASATIDCDTLILS